jgi:predicted nucleotidyltransferase
MTPETDNTDVTGNTDVTKEKRAALKSFIRRVLEPEPAVKAVVGIGSIATGHVRPDSDIDAVIFLDPFDLFIAPAEAIWRPEDNTFHSIFSDNVEGTQLDFTRLDWKQWADPDIEWSEGHRAELSTGWLAYDPSGDAAHLIAVRAAYPEEVRLARLDEAIVWLDQHLSGDQPRKAWDSLGPTIAHDRLEAAYDFLVQGLFAYNRQWRIWRNREMQLLLRLPWLPEDFANRALLAANAAGHDHDGYAARAEMLHSLFKELLTQLVANGDYSAAPIDQAFIRSNDEPGRAWNMEEWNKFHQARKLPGNGQRARVVGPAKE